MANLDSPFGLKPVMYLSGAPWTGKARRYYMDTAGQATYIGDPMALGGTATAEGVPTCVRATLADGNYTIGPIVAVEPETDDSTTYVENGDSRYVYIADDPNLIFEIQCDSLGTLAVTSIGLNAIGVNTHAGSAVTGLSGMELDTTTDPPAADASNMFMIMGAPRREDNDFDDTHGKVYVMISMHTYHVEDGRLGV